METMNLNKTDSFGRTVDYLRISITDRCNERCLYCLPENYSDWLPRGEILAYDELLAIVRATTALGFKRFRVTGGEPLIRPGVVEFIRDLVATPGVESVLLTTNGTRLPQLARPLFDAGLRRINISGPSPSRSATPGRNPSIRPSAVSASRETISTASGCLRSSVIERRERSSTSRP